MPHPLWKIAELDHPIAVLTAVVIAFSIRARFQASRNYKERLLPALKNERPAGATAKCSTRGRMSSARSFSEGSQ